jgi:hypothetical protein
MQSVTEPHIVVHTFPLPTGWQMPLAQSAFLLHGVPVPFDGAFWQVPLRHVSEPVQVEPEQQVSPSAPQKPASGDPSPPSANRHVPAWQVSPLAQTPPVQHGCSATPQTLKPPLVAAPPPEAPPLAEEPALPGPVLPELWLPKPPLDEEIPLAELPFELEQPVASATATSVTESQAGGVFIGRPFAFMGHSLL